MSKYIKIKILRMPSEDDWRRCKLLALNTIGKKYINEQITSEWKQKILASEHSPIRTLMFTIEMEVPYYVSVHFARHKIGVEHYVQSQRNDRQDNYDREIAPQSAIVKHIMDIDAQQLMIMARRRLCSKADPTTRYAMSQICLKIIQQNPEFKNFLQPMCIYRNGCNEFASCGYWNKNLMKEFNLENIEQ